VLCLFICLGLAHAGTISESNHYMDNLLTRVKSTALDTGFHVPDFDLKIKATGLTNRDLKGKWRNGRIKGFEAIRRKGDCNPTSLVGGNITLSCRLDMSGVHVKYEAEVKGYNLAGTEKKIDMLVKVKDTTAQFEASQDPRRDPTLRTFFIDSLKFDLEYIDLGLNDDRKKALKEEVVKKVTPSVYDAIYNPYSNAFRETLQRAGRLPSA